VVLKSGLTERRRDSGLSRMLGQWMNSKGVKESEAGMGWGEQLGCRGPYGRSAASHIRELGVRTKPLARRTQPRACAEAV